MENTETRVSLPYTAHVFGTALSRNSPISVLLGQLLYFNLVYLCSEPLKTTLYLVFLVKTKRTVYIVQMFLTVFVVKF